MRSCPSPRTSTSGLVTEVVPLLNADPAIDGVAPILFENVAVVNLDDRLFEISAVLTGLDPQACPCL